MRNSVVLDSTVGLSVIDGEAVEGSGAPFDVLDPATGAVVRSFRLATAADVDRAVAAARAAYPSWSRTTQAERSTVLHRLAGLLDDAAEELAAVETAQTGKPIRLSSGFDVPGTVDNTAFRRGRQGAGGIGGRRVLAGPHLDGPTRAPRRGRLNRTVELPAADGGMEEDGKTGTVSETSRKVLPLALRR